LSALSGVNTRRRSRELPRTISGLVNEIENV
jgi:hypothetical protein